MELQNITCPACGESIPLTAALTKQVENSLRKQLKAEVGEKEAALQKRAEELELAEQETNKRFQAQIQIEQQKITERIKSELAAKHSEQTHALEEELVEKRNQLLTANQHELDLRKQKQELEDAKNNLELTVRRQLDEERGKIFEQASKQAQEEQELKMGEKDMLLDNMKKQINELKRKSEVGSQEAQGEVLEKTLQSLLQQNFPTDKFTEVKKGIKGADILQIVFNGAMKNCGSILWEVKNTKLFAHDWINKLKKDQQTAKTEICVLMTIALPKDFKNFGIYEEVWITDYNSALGLASALRYGLIETTRQKIISSGNVGTKTLVYEYVTGKEFAMHIKVVASAFVKLQEDLESEKRAMSRIWKKREKQILMVLDNLTGMRGSIEGIAQKALPDVSVMSLDDISEDNN